MHMAWYPGEGVAKIFDKISVNAKFKGVHHFGFYCIFINNFLTICHGGVLRPPSPPPQVCSYVLIGWFWFFVVVALTKTKIWRKEEKKNTNERRCTNFI